MSHPLQWKEKLDREEILRRLREHKNELQQKFPIARLALFGSYARGEQNENSDIDILVS